MYTQASIRPLYGSDPLTSYNSNPMDFYRPTPLSQFEPSSQRTSPNDSEDKKYDFLFNLPTAPVMRISEMNIFNGKQITDLASANPNFMNSFAALADRIEKSTNEAREIKKRAEDLSFKMKNGVEERFRECILTAKSVYAKVKLLRGSLDRISGEIDFFSENLRDFADMFSKIKSDTRIFYEHPSKALLSTIVNLRKKLETVHYGLQDLAVLLEGGESADSEESDNLRNYLSVVEELNYYFQVVAKKAADLTQAVRMMKSRVGVNAFDRSLPRDLGSGAQDPVRSRIQELIEKIDKPSKQF